MIVKESLEIENYIIYQDTDLYRFTSDAVLLSRFAKVKPKEKVADFCSGSGIVGLNLYALNKEKVESVTMIEMQTTLYELSKKSVIENGLNNVIFPVNKKLQEIGGEYTGAFSLIVCNPPYAKADGGFLDEKKEIAVARAEITLTLKELIKAVSRCIKFGGRFCMCHRADRLADVIAELKNNNIEPKRLQFVYSGKNKEPYLLLIESVKGGKSGLKILENLYN